MYSEIVDLSILIENNMIYYPGDPEPELSKYITLEEDGCQVMKLNIGTHTGTHMDAPAHFVKNGKTIDNVNLKKCIKLVQRNFIITHIFQNQQQNI